MSLILLDFNFFSTAIAKLVTRNYNQVADYFSFGQILAEMVKGVPPPNIYREDGQLRYARYCRNSACNLKLYLPVNIPPELTQLIRELTLIHASCRLGRKGIDSVKGSLFFEGIIWHQFPNGVDPPSEFRRTEPLKYQEGQMQPASIDTYVGF